MFKRLKNLKGKVAVITGGGGQVGYATAYRLAEQGCRIVSLVRRDFDKVNSNMQVLPGRGHFAILADVTDSSSLVLAAHEVKKRAGRCDILINSAAISNSVPPANLDALTDEIFDSIVTTNLRGVFATIRAFAPMLKETKDGLIVNISSTRSESGLGNVAYGCSKAGVNLLTKNLAKALAPDVRIIAVCPGHMVEPTSGAIRTPEDNEKLTKYTPLKRICYADDIASTIEACCTHIRFATGSIFLVNGGMTA